MRYIVIVIIIIIIIMHYCDKYNCIAEFIFYCVMLTISIIMQYYSALICVINITFVF
jgi:hypothetical protein